MSDDTKSVFDLISPIVERARKQGARFADVRALAGQASSILVQDRRAEKMFYATAAGLAVRVLVDGSWGFASCDGLEPKLLNDCLDGALTLAKNSAHAVLEKGVIALVEGVCDDVRRVGKLDLDEVSLEKKQKLCLEFERQALDAGQGKIVNSVVSYGDGFRRQWLVNTAGTRVHTQITRAHVSCHVTAVEGDVRQHNYQALGHQGGPELLLNVDPETFSVKAGKKVVQQLWAKKAPAGEFPVIFHPTISGLLAHEALGHNAEADGIWAGESILQGKLGDQVASDLVTIVDDGTVPGCYGSEPYDNEGTATCRRVIIENGVFKEALHNLETAARFQTRPNGCGRAQDHNATPLCRMSNTFFEPGSASLDDMLKGIDRGIYLRESHGGYVYPERGQFLCHAHEAQMIEHGQLGEPLRDVSVGGLILETLKDIDMVGHDFQMSSPGTCGKGGQGVPVNDGGPHLRVSRMVVGGQGP